MARRLTQEIVEVVVDATGASLNRRLTQEIVESVVKATGASAIRRITQIAVEVLITNPVAPFGEQPGPQDIPWSPSLIAAGLDAAAQPPGGFVNPHPVRVNLGQVGTRIEIDRR